MTSHILSEKELSQFRMYLQKEEKSPATVEKYLRDTKAFFSFLADTPVSKARAIDYKQKLISGGYTVRSVNSMIAALNSLFAFLGWQECTIKSLRLQKEIFCSEEKELSQEEYERLCRAAEEKKDTRLSLILQTLCGTGIRISELVFVTVETVKKGEATVTCKGKTRQVFFVPALRQKLLAYIEKKKIKSGVVFVDRNGKPMSRTVIWRAMKRLCKEANVAPSKVFPHNLRHLFARIFQQIEKDITKLADILGHSSIDTTRIYVRTTGAEHRRRMEKMHLIL